MGMCAPQMIRPTGRPACAESGRLRALTVNSKAKSPEIELEPCKQLSTLTHRLFRQVVEAAPSAMVMADGDGLIVLVNAQTEKIFGYSREELFGRTHCRRCRFQTRR
ncbi:hypothetical protein R70211_06086 [Paraburkholderia domus]|uniref:PAS domain-containing protein n=1 Tax=Paraburkholderia domus TaxID=2793075 RepID=A0A9N8N9Y8_9BURK|nr:PAS domain S-box protein [Burkholderia sp. R-70211]CAE6947937.1 hypothetical protein R70211_06086 [Paraburkholderia domus]